MSTISPIRLLGGVGAFTRTAEIRIAAVALKEVKEVKEEEEELEKSKRVLFVDRHLIKATNYTTISANSASAAAQDSRESEVTETRSSRRSIPRDKTNKSYPLVRGADKNTPVRGTGFPVQLATLVLNIKESRQRWRTRGQFSASRILRP